MATFNQVGAVLLKKLNFFCFPLLMRRGLFPPVNISYRARRPKEETLDFPEILWKIQRACHPKLLTRLKRKVKTSLLPNWCWIIQIIQSVKLPLIMNSSGSVTGAGWQPSLTPTEVRKFSFDPDFLVEVFEREILGLKLGWYYSKICVNPLALMLKPYQFLRDYAMAIFEMCSIQFHSWAL